MTLPAGWTPTNEQTALGKEEILWKNQLTEGIFKKRVVEVQTITNYRVEQNGRSVMFKDIDDVVVMNQHRVSQSNYMGTYYGRYTRFGMGNSQSRSKTIGDVVFMNQGRTVMRFNQIADPSGVVRLAKSIRKTAVQLLKNEEKRKMQLQKENERDAKVKEKLFKQKKTQTSEVVVCQHIFPHAKW
jgi:hypothetical protein